jgi:hypothetical protein
MRNARLFHAIVSMGVALTGGIAACGGDTGSGEADAAAVDGRYDGIVAPDVYAQISIGRDVYNGISVDAAPRRDTGIDTDALIDTGIGDANGDCYPCIAPNPG